MPQRKDQALSENHSSASIFGELLAFARSLAQHPQGVLQLHEPVVGQTEKDWLARCIDSTFVSSVGPHIAEFEQKIAEFTGSAHAVAMVNGTAALHIALLLAGVEPGTEVITQPLSFVATANAVTYCGAKPVFVDCDAATLGMSPEALTSWLQTYAKHTPDGKALNRSSGKRLAACVPMHTIGFPCQIEEIADTCADWGIPLIEDAAEALGSWRGRQHCGTFGLMGVLSFNGNKVITTGGGGMILTGDPELAARAKHLTTTAKADHPYEFIHEELGFNYRLPNLNAALGLAQMERLPGILKAKRHKAEAYADFCAAHGLRFLAEPSGTTSNYWLSSILMDTPEQAQALLQAAHSENVGMRPLWRLLSDLPMYCQCQRGSLAVARDIQSRVVNLPSGVNV